MDDPVTTSSLVDFVHNFTNRKLPRFLNARISDLFDTRVNTSPLGVRPSKVKRQMADPGISGRSISLRDMDSHTFSETILNANKV